MGQQQVLVRRGLRDSGAERGQGILRTAPGPPGRFKPCRIATRETIEQRTMAARIDQAAIILLAMQLHQMPPKLAQKRHAHAVIVDESLAAAVCAQLPLENEGFARLD